MTYNNIKAFKDAQQHHELELLDDDYDGKEKIKVENIDEIEVIEIKPKKLKNKDLPKVKGMAALSDKELKDILKKNDGRTAIAKEAKKELNKRK